MVSIEIYLYKNLQICTVFPQIVSFLNLTLCTVTKGAETIQGRKLLKGGNYMRKYGISFSVILHGFVLIIAYKNMFRLIF